MPKQYSYLSLIYNLTSLQPRPLVIPLLEVIKVLKQSNV